MKLTKKFKIDCANNQEMTNPEQIAKESMKFILKKIMYRLIL